jgi:hypothetical protein
MASEVLLKGTVEHTDRGSNEVFSGVKFVAAGLIFPSGKSRLGCAY